MLRQDSMSTNLARVAVEVAEHGGTVTDRELDDILRVRGISRQRNYYKARLVEYGYLNYGPRTQVYTNTPNSMDAATIVITVRPSLFANEVRRDLVERLAGFAGVIEIGDAEL